MLALVVASTALQSQMPMGFTLPLTRLSLKHLRPLCCQRIGPPATLTTWISTLYVRLIDSLECQDAVLTWILTKLYNEAPPRTSWNYVLSISHHHELLLTGVMELRVDQWGTTMQPLRNYVLTILKSCFSNQHKVIIHTNFMSTFITNHLIHVTCQDHAQLINFRP